MDYVRLGHSGLKVSRLVLGCMTFGDVSWSGWALDEAASRPLLRKALDLGINTFDTADFYSLGRSEEIVGRALKEGASRHSVVIATKLFNVMGPDPNNRGLSRKHVFEAVDASLRRLGTDYIDLYMIHRFDPETPLEESLDALNDVVRAGKVRYLGASSMYAWQFMKALGLQRQHGWARFIAMQNHYNLLYREEEREMLPLCRSEGIGVIPWSPLARGHLAGNRREAQAPSLRAGKDKAAMSYYGAAQDAAIIDAVRTVAARHGRPMAQIAYAWAATRPGITAPIVGLSRLEQYDDAVAALDVTLTAKDIAAMEAPYRPLAIVAHV